MIGLAQFTVYRLGYIRFIMPLKIPTLMPGNPMSKRPREILNVYPPTPEEV